MEIGISHARRIGFIEYDKKMSLALILTDDLTVQIKFIKKKMFSTTMINGVKRGNSKPS